MKDDSVPNVYACLVHEAPDCVADLVRNLHHLDPASRILLYNGGTKRDLLDRVRLPLDAYNATVHPEPRPLNWGRLHDFAVDCMRFCMDFEFGALTIVDSDQLALRAGYSTALEEYLSSRPRLGHLGSRNCLPRGTLPMEQPALRAWSEKKLWQPLLDQFPNGEVHFVQWGYWPSTVFSAEACRSLVRFWDTNRVLPTILARSRICATEEVVLPTLVALLGFESARSPFRGNFVRYRTRYSRSQLFSGLRAPAGYWLHPVPRRYADPIRAQVRRYYGEYGTAQGELADSQRRGAR